MKKKEKEMTSIEIELAHKTYSINKMSNAAVYKLDNVLDMPLMELVYKVSSNRGFRISDAWKIIWVCVSMKSPDMSFENFIDETDNSGITVIELIEMASQIIGNTFASEEKGKGDSDSKN